MERTLPLIIFCLFSFLQSYGRVVTITPPSYMLTNGGPILGGMYMQASQSIDLNFDGISDLYFNQITFSFIQQNILPSCPSGGQMDSETADIVYSLSNNLPAGSSIFYTGYYPYNSTSLISNNLIFNKTYAWGGAVGQSELGDFHRYSTLRSQTNPPPVGQCLGTYPGVPWGCISGVLCAGAGYIGFKLKLNGLEYYGYMHFLPNNSAPWFKLDYVAFENVPGFPITIGNSIGYFALTSPFNIIKGSLYYDANNNCVKDAGEPGISNTRVFVSNSTYGGNSDANGNYEILVPNGTGSYNVTADTNLFKLTCPATKYLTVATSGVYQTYTGKNLGFTGSPCSNLKISLSSNRRRRCFRNRTGVTYRNDGLISASGVYVKIIMPPQVKAISSTPAWTSQSGDTLIYSIGSISALSSGTIQIIDSVICGDESIRGLTVCTKALISPKTYCNSPNWDLSDVTLTGQCLGNTYSAILKNSGLGPMADSLNYRIYLDNVLVKTTKFKLLSQDTLGIIIPTSGMTVRVETDQSPYHPELTQRAIYDEGCGIGGTDSISKGIINNFPNDPSQIGEASSCMVIRDSYDPNEKTATPEGAFIAQDHEITFTIRFQNTGSDTAYTVVIADTLNPNLDASTLQTIASSHPYKFELTGNNNPRMAWIFGGINLIDSTTNEKASHGFVTYKVRMKPGLSNGTIITNRAQIYFDYNSAIMTNKIVKTVGKSYLDSTFSLTSVAAPDTICENASGLIKITAKGQSLKYYWKKDGVPVAFSGSAFSISSADSAAQGEYICMVKSLMDSIEVKKNISVRFLPVIMSSLFPIDVCENSGIKTGVLAKGTGIKYQWFKDAVAVSGEISDSLRYASFLPSQSGAYFCKVSNACTFANSNIVNLTANKYPILINAATKDLCDGSLFDLTSNFSDGNSMLGTVSYWSDSALTVPLNNPSAISGQGIYYISKISDKGCSDTSSLSLIFHPNPITTGISVVSICEPGLVDLTANVTPDPNVQGALTYYQGNNFTPVVSPSAVNQTGVFHIIESSSFGCNDTIQISVNILPKPDLQVINSAILCGGQSVDLGRLYQDFNNTSGTFIYYKEQVGADTSSQTVSDPAIYFVVKTTAQGCSDTTSLQVMNGICTGIQSQAISGVMVYPNPVVNSLIINPENSMAFSIEVSDVKGNLLYSCQASGKKEVDFSGFTQGTYLVRISSGNKSTTYPVVKH